MKPIERLKEQFIKYLNSGRGGAAGRDYKAMREFALDCNLVAFNELEVMEYEVKQKWENHLTKNNPARRV